MKHGMTNAQLILTNVCSCTTNEAFCYINVIQKVDNNVKRKIISQNKFTRFLQFNK